MALKAMMSTQKQDKAKKSLEFKMCKKIAELTQVVQMLSTKNYEKDLLFESLKKSYEHEIELVVKDARERLDKVQLSGENLKHQGIKDLEHAMLAKEQDMLNRESYWCNEVAHYEQLLRDEKSESQNLRDLLIGAQRDIEKLRQGAADRTVLHSQEAIRRDKEEERLREQVAVAEKKLNDALKSEQAFHADFQTAKEKLEKELAQTKEALNSSQKTLDHSLARNKELENEVEILQMELSKTINDQHKATLRSENPNEELARLRRDVQRYRLELSNREHNFNRMFSEKKPRIIKQKQHNASFRKSADINYSPNHSGQNRPNYSPNHSGQTRPNYSTHPINVIQSIDFNRKGSISKINAFTKEQQNIQNDENNIEKMDNQLTLYLRRSIFDDIRNIEVKRERGSVIHNPGLASFHEKLVTEERNQGKATKLSPSEEGQLLFQKIAQIQSEEEKPSCGSHLPPISCAPPHHQALPHVSRPKS